MISLVKKRSGSIVEFNRTRIEEAISKAYQATEIPISEDAIILITDHVVEQIEATFSDERIPTVEAIQDIVEKEIANKGDFLVARAYIIYRSERARIREERQKETLEKIERQEISVKKRSGKVVTFDEKEIERAITNVCSGFEHCVNVPEILSSVKLNIYDGITTGEINKAIVMTMKSQIEREPAFAYISARLLMSDLHKDVLGTDEFSSHFEMLHKKNFAESIHTSIKAGRLDPRMKDFDLERLAGALKPERDHLFEYLGLQVLYDRYFLRDEVQKLLEVPQYFWMRVAMGLALTEDDKEARAIEFYETISQMLYVPSTPTLLHSGMVHAQMSSCYLSTITDDLEHIFKCIGDNAQLSKWSGGIGQDVTYIRATNALVKAINTGSQGVIPFIKVIDSTSNAINRSGKRRGATCVYLETWHMDIEDFLDLRKNTGDDRRRAHDTNTANWIPDLFMKRINDGAEWTLFSPEEVPELHDLYGQAFEEKYVEYEAKAEAGGIKLWKRVKAQDLWRKMLMMIYETGHPWITWKDPSNIRSPQDHVGVIHNSNLCTEITLNTSIEETAVCNIGSVNLVRHFQHGVFNRALLATTVKTAMRMLDNVIDLNFYPTKEGQTSNFRHRPVGLGVMGTQDLFYEMNLQFDSEIAVEFSDELQEFVSWHAIMASAELAKEKGAYSTFKGSKWDRGLFPVDTIKLLEDARGIATDIPLTAKMDWTPVREAVKTYGLRNSNTMAIAPTATISNISGCLPSVEPIYKNIYVKSNFSGEFTIVNQYLIHDLKERGLWTRELLEKIKFYDGSLEKIQEIPLELRNKYKEVFQIDSYWIIAHAARRGKWIDQSQSINLFMKTESGRAISDAYMSAWKMGLKTTYYLRTLGASAIEKSTVDINKTYTESPIQKEDLEKVEAPTGKPKLHVFKDETCESCQ